MGVGRRMKKQGPPEPLSEEHFAKLKRKAGLPVDAPTEAPTNKKRKTGKKAAEPQTSNGAALKTKRKNGVTGAGHANAKSPKKQQRNGRQADPKPLDTESDSELDDEFGDSDLNQDETSSSANTGGVLEGPKLGDDFLGSDDSVYDSDAEHRKEEFVFSEDEDDDSDREERLTAANIEGLSRKLDKKLAREAAEAEEELRESALQTNIDGDQSVVMGDGADDDLAVKTQDLMAPDLQLLRTRITDTIRILEDFSRLAEPGRSRAEYTSQLLKDICAYYGYSEFLAEKLFNLFPPREAFAFFEANESARPIVIRTNTLRTHRRDLAQALINRGVTLEPVGKWSKVGLQIFESSVPLGATPEYLAGHYILQAASSFLPVMALCPQENERVLDMAAAPGGKTTHMAALMKNTGVIFANDPSKARAKGLIGNIHRLGARNVIVCNYDAREFPRVIGGFDRVLLDAPCSGTGVISRDPSVKTNKDEKDFKVLPHTQKQLLLAAIDSVNHNSKTGGYLVYSTCSVTVEENEQVVAYALSRRPNVKLVETGLTFGREGFTSYMGKHFDPSLKLTRRYYPHVYNGDGFFVAKFKKIGPTPPNAVLADKKAGAAAARKQNVETDEVVDKTPIGAEESNGTQGDDFGGFDDEEDSKYIDRAKRNAMRRRGLDPRALDKNKSKNGLPEKNQDLKKELASEKNSSATKNRETTSQKQQTESKEEHGGPKAKVLSKPKKTKPSFQN
ncbi:hypothetical protein VTK73DRAFT_46 [Phialemonium thermophilum]|uniref:SAM-dependent MTase RsmB/NOP-type domain-containing protein n=1 Tax=Phialemonium thermophilum TaxID=223376 RepID=A0ABR3Y995_9PEZI